MINIANTWKRLAKKFDVIYWVKSHVKKKLKIPSVKKLKIPSVKKKRKEREEKSSLNSTYEEGAN